MKNTWVRTIQCAVKILACSLLLQIQQIRLKKPDTVTKEYSGLTQLAPTQISGLHSLILLTAFTIGGCTPMTTQADPDKQPIYDDPYYWPYSDVAPPKLPEAPQQSTYRPGMSQRDYFQALCEREAGEFIYKTVDDVEGIYQIRPRHYARDPIDLHSQYALEDPYGYARWEAVNPHFIFIGKKGYSFFEAPDHSGRFVRYTGYDGRHRDTLQQETVQQLKARYGYFWRGIERPHMRDMIIAGGELVIVDLKTNEIIALRRGFSYSGQVRNSPTRISWSISISCPNDSTRKNLFYTEEFMHRVLKPLSKNQAVEGNSK